MLSFPPRVFTLCVTSVASVVVFVDPAYRLGTATLFLAWRLVLLVESLFKFCWHGTATINFAFNTGWRFDSGGGGRQVQMEALRQRILRSETTLTEGSAP